MAVHFNFIVDDGDAENIISLIRSNIDKNNMHIMKCMIKEDHDTRLFLERDNQYIESLIQKMTNTRV